MRVILAEGVPKVCFGAAAGGVDGRQREEHAAVREVAPADEVFDSVQDDGCFAKITRRSSPAKTARSANAVPTASRQRLSESQFGIALKLSYARSQAFSAVNMSWRSFRGLGRNAAAWGSTRSPMILASVLLADPCSP